ncbi:MAG: sugar-transfer associated ATP-grasp domain-containing protein [Pseudomonadota bacterium]
MKFETTLMVLCIAIFGLQFWQTDLHPNSGLPVRAYQIETKMKIDSRQQNPMVATYLPESNQNQQVLAQEVKAIRFSHSEQIGSDGKLNRWVSDRSHGEVSVETLLHRRAVRFELDGGIELPNEIEVENQAYLSGTEFIQVDHAEISALWKKIKPQDEKNTLAVLKRIFNYVAELETIPFKGTTDALTALRLQAASCNGKSRLFTSLARLNGLPTRLVGGLVLGEETKRTSHQWVEVNVQGMWVPFDPTNGHFASLPDNYLRLYTGDHALFRYSPESQFDYHFKISPILVAPSLLTTNPFNSGSDESQPYYIPSLKLIADSLGLSAQATLLILLLPLAALLISFARNVVGVNTFGVFMPMLVALACVNLGLLVGVSAFLAVLLVGFGALLALKPLRLLKIPRLAAVVTIINSVLILGLVALHQLTDVQLSLLSLYPIIIWSFVADRLSDLVEEREWRTLLAQSLGTLVLVLVCYLCFKSVLLQSLIGTFPQLLLIILAAQIYVGKWTGIRLSESIRFSELLKNGHSVLGINQRNLALVQAQNSKALLRTANNKLESKQVLARADVPVPATLAEFESIQELEKLTDAVAEHRSWVLKPNCGSQGNGILVLTRLDEERWQAGGKAYDVAAVQRHILKIIHGVFSSSGDKDIAYIEPCIRQHQTLQSIAPYGLSDLRLILNRGRIVSAMWRIPTKKSQGKANLHQGAIGAAIDIDTGLVRFNADKPIQLQCHPDSGAMLNGITMPHWPRVKDIARRSTSAIPLGYAGVDICLDDDMGPLVLEINGRPGLEIQNITQLGLIDALNAPNCGIKEHNKESAKPNTDYNGHHNTNHNTSGAGSKLTPAFAI